MTKGVKLPEGVSVIQVGNKAMIVGQGENGTEALIGNAEFPYPSAPAVDSRYLKAVEDQNKKRENRGRIRLVD